MTRSSTLTLKRILASILRVMGFYRHRLPDSLSPAPSSHSPDVAGMGTQQASIGLPTTQDSLWMYISGGERMPHAPSGLPVRKTDAENIACDLVPEAGSEVQMRTIQLMKHRRSKSADHHLNQLLRTSVGGPRSGFMA